MPIDYITKDITTVKSGDGVIYHGCNCSGGYGSGVAGAIRKKWPHAYESFKEMGVGEHLLGSLSIALNIYDPPIVNAFTQVYYGPGDKRYADPDAIFDTLYKTAEFVDGGGYKAIYMPKVGCGLGGLSWEDDVRSKVELVSEAFPEINIYICDI